MEIQIGITASGNFGHLVRPRTTKTMCGRPVAELCDLATGVSCHRCGKYLSRYDIERINNAKTLKGNQK